jgi:hypothetical protein
MDHILCLNMTLHLYPLRTDAQLCATETKWGRPLSTRACRQG